MLLLGRNKKNEENECVFRALEEIFWEEFYDEEKVSFCGPGVWDDACIVWMKKWGRRGDVRTVIW